LAFRPAYRRRHWEFERISQAPRNKPIATDLLGKHLELADGPSFRSYHWEIFERQIYRFGSTDESPVIIDGGANIGLSVIYLKRLFPKSLITAFEPDPDIFQVLKRNCESFSLSDVNLEPKALWTCDTVLRFERAVGDAGYISTEGSSDSIIEVQACRLRDYLQGKVHFLKIDIEGAETDVILDCADVLHNVEHLFVEYHSAVNKEQSLDVLLRILREAGFRVSVEACNSSTQPFISRNVNMGFDLQLNIFAVRQGKN
jgi:FkbM family methyltransferase